jgi:uncharacterized membrane protein YgdD (TMEM256/DUF423 family)
MNVKIVNTQLVSIRETWRYNCVSNSEMSNFFVEQGRKRFCGEAYSTYVATGKLRRTPLGGKRAIYGWTLVSVRRRKPDHLKLSADDRQSDLLQQV